MPRRGTRPADLPTMSFLEHLEELRKRLLRSVFAVAGAFALCLMYARHILDFFLSPLQPFLHGQKPVFLELTEPFMLYMKVAFLAALFLASPFVLYQLWAFIRPGLYPRERRYAIPFIVAAVITPTPDVGPQCVFAGPMILLYLIGILVAHVFGRERAAAPATEES